MKSKDMKSDKRPGVRAALTTGSFQYPNHALANRITDLSALKRQARMMKMAMVSPGNFVSHKADIMNI